MSDLDHQQVSEGIENVLGSLFSDVAKPYEVARDKYLPLVRRLSLTEYIGLRMAVESERANRMAQAIRDNPLVGEIARLRNS